MPDLFICSLGVSFYVPRCDLSAGTTGRDTRTYVYVMCTGRSVRGLRAGLHPLDGETHPACREEIRNARRDSCSLDNLPSAFSPSPFFLSGDASKLFRHGGLAARLSASPYVHAKRNTRGRCRVSLSASGDTCASMCLPRHKDQAFAARICPKKLRSSRGPCDAWKAKGETPIASSGDPFRLSSMSKSA